jgi:hypothetical protein
MTESVSVSAKTAAKDIKAAKTTKPRAVKPRAAATKVAKEKKAATSSRLSPEDRHRMISERAYLLAEQRGFQGGDAVNDWLAAEAEVDGMSKPKRGKRAAN